MAGSRYEYVRTFEMPDNLLPGTFLLFRLDGHAFHRFSKEHDFNKPNDERALQLMDKAARTLMEEYPDIVLAFGESDEYSFLFRKSTSVHNRRASKMNSLFTSLFTASYIFYWNEFFPDLALKYPPSFDGRVVCYPTATEVRDYFSWRQADTHINNLYNTVFWALVQQGGESTEQAHATLKYTLSKEKHEIMFKRFEINYNDVDERFRKGSVLVTERIVEKQADVTSTTLIPNPESAEGSVIGNSDSTAKNNRNSVLDQIPTEISKDRQNLAASTDRPHTNRKIAKLAKQMAKMASKEKPKTVVQLLHCDIIKDEFWVARPWLLTDG